MVLDKFKAIGLLADPQVRKVLSQFPALKTEDQKALIKCSRLYRNF